MIHNSKLVKTMHVHHKWSKTKVPNHILAADILAAKHEKSNFFIGTMWFRTCVALRQLSWFHFLVLNYRCRLTENHAFFLKLWWLQYLSRPCNYPILPFWGKAWSKLFWFKIGVYPPFVTIRQFSLRNNLINRAEEILLELFVGSYSAYKYFFLTEDLNL